MITPAVRLLASKCKGPMLAQTVAELKMLAFGCGTPLSGITHVKKKGVVLVLMKYLLRSLKYMNDMGQI